MTARESFRMAGTAPLALCVLLLASTEAFTPASLNKVNPAAAQQTFGPPSSLAASRHDSSQESEPTLWSALANAPLWKHATNVVSGIAVGGFLTSMVMFSGPVWAENELSDKYGGGLDTSLVDQTCMVDQCSLQAKACLADDPNCRKGLTCTAKCLGDNSCITGCFARYGNQNLDRLLKCTIEDHECIKIAILPGGADKFGEEPRAPAPTVQNFDPRTLQGNWYKVVGYNPNYDCYACQKNSFQAKTSSNPLLPVANDKLDMQVQFSMPHMLPDGSPPPPSGKKESIQTDEDGQLRGFQSSIALNDYYTRETMVFDQAPNPVNNLVRKNGKGELTSYSRTAHSEGEMFGLSKLHIRDGSWTNGYAAFYEKLTCLVYLSPRRVLGELVCDWRERSRCSRVQVRLLQWQDASEHVRRRICL